MKQRLFYTYWAGYYLQILNVKINYVTVIDLILFY